MPPFAVEHDELRFAHSPEQHPAKVAIRAGCLLERVDSCSFGGIVETRSQCERGAIEGERDIDRATREVRRWHCRVGVRRREETRAKTGIAVRRFVQFGLQLK